MNGDWRHFYWLSLSIGIILADQWSKAWIIDHFVLYETRTVIPGLLNGTLIYNTGAAFGFLNQAGGWQHWLFSGIALLASVGILLWMMSLERHERSIAAGLSLILGGAIGNLLDRLQHGHVIDFIQVYYQQWYFPAFNIADSAITLGAVLLIFNALMDYKNHSNTKNNYTKNNL